MAARFFRRLAAVAVTALALAPAAAAQQGRGRSFAEDPEPIFSIAGSVRSTFGAGFDSTAGDVDILRTAATATLSFPLGQDVLTVLPYARRYQYRFTGPTPFAAAAPWDNITAYGFWTDYFTRLSEDWTLQAAVGVEDASETGATLSAISYRGRAIAGWKVSEDFSLFGGVFHLHGIEANLTAPIFGFNWNIFEELGLLSDSDGTRLEFEPDPRWAFSLGWAGDAFQARLNPRAATPNGVLQALELDLGFRASWQPEEGRDITLRIMTNAFHQLELQNRFGGFFAQDNLDPALVVELSFGFRF